MIGYLGNRMLDKWVPVKGLNVPKPKKGARHHQKPRRRGK
jgi:hypothetical protein